MSLTAISRSFGATDGDLVIRRTPDETVVALAGNPNVGKSTVFNALTGMKQHTGNWPGKTVANARGRCVTAAGAYTLVDIPGAYSLHAHSPEEEVARNFLCFGDADAVVVVCDATCLERNLNLVLQILEISPNAVVCVNLMDEARRKGVAVDLELIASRLGVPVVGTVARSKRSLGALTDAVDRVCHEPSAMTVRRVEYPPVLEKAIAEVQSETERLLDGRLDPRFVAMRLIEDDAGFRAELHRYLGFDIAAACETAVARSRAALLEAGIDGEALKDITVSAIVGTAEEICRGAVTRRDRGYAPSDKRLDRVLTGRLTAYPVMLALLAGIFWLTISGANYISEALADVLFRGEALFTSLLVSIGAPPAVTSLLTEGVYRVLAWVVSVMLPPMAIFFPLFTLLEDAGYLPRVAYNLDRPFKRCSACGKQALSMCMGFGCNAAGVTGCRIIDSPRERLLAVLTNSLVPCNGRFPMLTAVMTMFLVGTGSGAAVAGALGLTAVIVLGVAATFAATKLLSVTVLKGTPSSFTLELPPYRMPQPGRVIVRSLLDRTLFVLGRAVAVAAPAGLVIWLMANISVNGVTLLAHVSGFLDPFARLMGLDGVILTAFILGFPANETVVPIMIMTYMAGNSLAELGGLGEMQAMLIQNGWTWRTAVSFILFALMHWPCSTTLWTVKKETGSMRWTALAAAVPTLMGVLAAMLFTLISGLFA